MLWDLVRDFFVMHVFGGYTSTHASYQCAIGYLKVFYEGEYDESFMSYTNSYGYLLSGKDSYPSAPDVYITLGDYLSTMATIITMVIIVTLCVLFIWKIIKLIGGLIR